MERSPVFFSHVFTVSCPEAADARARGFLLGATAGRTTLNGEGLQHQDCPLELREPGEWGVSPAIRAPHLKMSWGIVETNYGRSLN